MCKCYACQQDCAHENLEIIHNYLNLSNVDALECIECGALLDPKDHPEAYERGDL